MRQVSIIGSNKLTPDTVAYLALAVMQELLAWWSLAEKIKKDQEELPVIDSIEFISPGGWQVADVIGVRVHFFLEKNTQLRLSREDVFIETICSISREKVTKIRRFTFAPIDVVFRTPV